MKRTFLIIVLLLLAVGTIPTLAQQRDTDGDGISDGSDACPTVPGVPENNGCPPVFQVVPPVPPQPTDTDGDGIPDSDAACPTVAGPRENRGCPTENPPGGPVVIDTDGDGTPDSGDACPTVVGPRENRGCPTENPPGGPVVIDTDGDGTPDSGDACPTVVGPRENRGCPTPENATPVPPNPNSGEAVQTTGAPFTPPVLPNDRCMVTPNGDYRVNVRELPDENANLLGHLLPGVIYPAEGYTIVNGTDLWFVLTSYEGSTGTTGYAARSVTTASPCTQLGETSATAPIGGQFPWQVSTRQVSTDGGSQNPTIEYCVYLEVQEAGVFEQVCYEVEIPEGCVVISNEAGVFTVDCGQGVISVDPTFEERPAELVEVPTQQGVIGLSIIFTNGPPGTNNPTIEYCVYEEAVEAGVFVLVCHKIEVPEGCWLNSAEVGVYTIVCRPEIGGEATFTFNPVPSGGSSNRPNWQEIFDDLLACQPGQVFWVNFQEPEGGLGVCLDTREELDGVELPEGSTILVSTVPNEDTAAVNMPFEVWDELVAQFCHPQGYWVGQGKDGTLTGGCFQPQSSTEWDTRLQFGLALRETNPEPSLTNLLLPQGSGGTLENDLTPGHFCPEGKEPFAIWEEDTQGNVVPGSVVIECLDPDFWD